ncbi:uncharacterized protein LAJ45_08507 [Morchella importuna]|uniref:uncharacterized protein n=1 Tax=Morchella importuna TaxID=1174673 RepID=UPI001E8E9DFD|nr:uncharacterized protein LAJ45_08507 [Morchella importuna]KAH8147351.1 hypothetical protein LAJ45_08507 [Morchella importuna]
MVCPPLLFLPNSNPRLTSPRHPQNPINAPPSAPAPAPPTPHYHHLYHHHHHPPPTHQKSQTPHPPHHLPHPHHQAHTHPLSALPPPRHKSAAKQPRHAARLPRLRARRRRCQSPPTSTTGAVVQGEGEGVGKKSMKSRPGAMKRKEKVVRNECERFGKNLAIMAAGMAAAAVGEGQGEGQVAVAVKRPSTWEALRGFIEGTMERKEEFVKKEEGEKEDEMVL